MGKPDIEQERKFHDGYFADHSPRQRENQFYDLFSKDIILDDIYAEMPDLRGKRVLYYGCGENVGILDRFYAAGADVFLFDLSEVALRKIRARHPAAKAVVTDAHHLAFRDHQFDLILGRGILHHLDVDTALSETKRTTAASGQVIFIEPLGINPLIRLYRALTPKSRTVDEHPFGFREIKMIEASFPSFSCRYYFLITLLPTLLRPFLNQGSLFKKFFITCNAFDKVLFRALPFLRYMAWIGVFRLSK
jgi:ubiquinone/menaquinone biosynthesis C-methylase UbiE